MSRQTSTTLFNTVTYGVTPTGFVYKPYTVIFNDLTVAMQAAFGADLDVSIDTPNGQLVGIVSAGIAELWQQENAIYDAYNPNAAFGISLKNIGVITYTPALIPSPTTVPAVIVASPGTFLPAAIVQIQTEGTGFTFHFAEDVTVPLSGTITVQAISDVNGPIQVPIGSLTKINTPITGWTSVNNTVAGTPGQGTETDPEYRVRRNNAAAMASQNVEDALRTALLAVPGVVDAIVLSNNQPVYDSNGFKPNSIAVVVEGGLDEDVAQTIYGRKTSSIPTNGTIEIDIPNNAGILIPVFFYRNQQITFYVKIIVRQLSGFPVDGLSQIQQDTFNFLTGVNNGGIPVFNIGQNIIISQFYTPINQTPTASVVSIAVDIINPPVNTADYTILFNQLPVFTLENIQVIGE